MRMIDVVLELQSQGHQIDYYIRKDGGILIKSIDGKRYPSGASGNAVAREMVGASLSEAKVKQLQYATRVRKKRRPTLDEEIQVEFKRVKKIWNKVFKAKGGTPHPAGYFGKDRIAYANRMYGKEEALRRIKEAERYATGYAYSKNIEILAGFIRDASQKYGSEELMTLAEDVMSNAYSIREEWIYPAYEELYKLNVGMPPSQVAKNVRKILRLW